MKITGHPVAVKCTEANDPVIHEKKAKIRESLKKEKNMIWCSRNMIFLMIYSVQHLVTVDSSCGPLWRSDSDKCHSQKQKTNVD